MSKINIGLLALLLSVCAIGTAVTVTAVSPTIDSATHRAMDMAESGRSVEQAMDFYELASRRQRTSAVWMVVFFGAVGVGGTLLLAFGGDLAKQGRLLLKEIKGKRPSRAKAKPTTLPVREYEQPALPADIPTITGPSDQRPLLTDGREGERWI